MRNYYRRLNTITVIAGLALSAATTVVGTIGEPPFAGILGAIITFLLGIQNAFRFAQNASIWELKHGEAKGIRDRLIYRVKDEAEFNQVVDDWIKFREGLLQNLPGVRGLDEIGVKSPSTSRSQGNESE